MTSALRLPPPAFLMPAALRVAGIFSAAAWYDELYTFHLVKQSPVEIVRLLMLDFNPPLWEFVLWLPMRIFPSVYTQRVIALLFSWLGIYLVWRLASRLFPDKDLTGLALLLCMPGLIWPGQDGRVYALFMALYLAAVLAVLDRNWIRLFALCGLMLYGHGTGVVWVGAVLLFGLVSRVGWKPIIWTGASAGLVWLPWLPMVLGAHGNFYRWGIGQIDLFVNFNFTFWPGVFSVPLLVLGGGVIGLTIIPWSKWRAGWLLSWLPIVGIGVLSVVSNANLFIYRVMQIALPTLLIYVWAGGWKWMVGAMTLIGLLFWNPAIRGGYLDAEVTIISEQWQDGDVIFATTGTAALPVAYELNRPVQVMNYEHHPGLLRTETLRAFGFPLVDFPTADRVWIVTPADPLLDAPAVKLIEAWTGQAERVGMVWYQQAARLDIYLWTNP